MTDTAARPRRPGWVLVVLLLGVPLVLLVTTLVLWIVRTRTRWSVGAACAAVLAPLAVGGVVALLPADCSEGQWARHGDEGCQRNLEEYHR